ncbi:hypothetical protein HHUSO_G21217 [Huso huso]|uniref:Uncharacterized protein n=1 Tax=Huso huso TaxID=61971 RepID=A0ABR0Y1Y9_HUSHU
MADTGAVRRSIGRPGSGLLLRAPANRTETEVLCESLSRLSGVTRAITANIRGINGQIERILLDKPDIDELEDMLNKISKN